MDITAAAWLEKIVAATARDQALIAARSSAQEDMSQTADKVAALLDVARALDAIGAAYALIGGVAVAIHAGIPRATLDTDIAVVSTVDRATVTEAMQRIGFHLVGNFEHSTNFRHSSGEPVQVAFDAEFDPMILRADNMAVGQVNVRIVRKDDLIVMKRRAAADPSRRSSKALRDRADVELLLGDVPDPDEGW